MYEAFFSYARARQHALLAKRAGVPKGQQSDDPILNHYKFCNVFREDDRTTIWLRENVRETWKGRPELLLYTILFRWFNRISTGESIFTRTEMSEAWWAEPGKPASFMFEAELSVGDLDAAFNVLRTAIRGYQYPGPYVTGAYCIIGMPHMSKLDGILACVRNVVEGTQPFNDSPIGWNELARFILWSAERGQPVMMESVWDWFRRFLRSGDFMAYEIVTDLQHSPGFLDAAPDRMTWANAGPGAIRGLNRIHDRPLEQQHPKATTNSEMMDILLSAEGAFRTRLWPTDWPKWDMRTVEHTLCEFDKYERIRLNQGRVKGVYR